MTYGAKTWGLTQRLKGNMNRPNPQFKDECQGFCIRYTKTGVWTMEWTLVDYITAKILEVNAHGQITSCT